MSGERKGEETRSMIGCVSDLQIDRESDGGDDLSQYSSCGGESEMERYYSAGSATGSPRVAGRMFQNFDFGSTKGFNLGGGSGVRSNCGEERLSSDREPNGVSSPGLRGKLEASVESNGDSNWNYDVDVKWPDGVSVGDGNSGNRVRRSISRQLLDDGEDLKIDGDEEGEPPLSPGYSEGEDSMFSCGSDDERKTNYYYRKNQLSHEQEIGRTDDHLLMDSAAAFGSGDWDDFVDESQERSVLSMAWGESQTGKQSSQNNGIGSLCLTADLGAYSLGMLEGRRPDIGNTSLDSNQVKADCESAEKDVGTKLASPRIYLATSDEAKSVPHGLLLTVDDDFEDHIEWSSNSKLFEMDRDSLKRDVRFEELNCVGAESEIRKHDITAIDIVTICRDIDSETRNLKETTIESDTLSEQHQDSEINSPVMTKKVGGSEALEDVASLVLPLAGTTTSSTTNEKVFETFDQNEDHYLPVVTKDVELNDFYNEIVDDMQDVLLDSGELPQTGVTRGSRMYEPQISRPSRDGGPTSSTSETNSVDWIQHVPKIDRVEVVGASQKKGDVSFSERLVGVQKHAVYKIRVWSGEHHWDIERRYRDFSTLYYRLNKSFADKGLSLPSPWSAVETESLKIFGRASPNVVADRSVLIQECLQSIISANISSGFLNSLSCFLAPSEIAESDSSLSRPSKPNRELGDSPPFGKTISLIVHIQPLKSTKEMLDLQYYRCAGCCRNFNDGTSRIWGFVEAIGWGKPRYCEYSGRLFCSSCHVYDTAVLPSRVLHYWDFSLYPVSQLAKSYLDSIHDQPMLCVGAINPFLLSKVPTLQHVANIRNRIRTVLPYVRCPFRQSIYKGLGSRSYLLDSNDFFALKDLIDLSKGVFSVLVAMVEALSRNIEDHVTELCLVCYDVGVPCSAGQACIIPLSLIFPFQQGDVERCKSCELIYHTKCFKKIASCSCGATLQRSASSDEKLVGRYVEPRSGFVTGLLSRVLPSSSQLPWKYKTENAGNNAISMASLPNAYL